jgi:predicted transposase/invertase (TIGR01784 family)
VCEKSLPFCVFYGGMDPSPRHRHDRSYRRLFSKPRLVEELIRGFFDEPWVERLDFTTLEPADGSFVGKNLRAREVDLIWKLKTRKGRPVYVYLLLELQSTVDRYMAVRMMGGTAQLYQSLIDHKALPRSGKLPLVIPIVLYNGSRRWSPAIDVAELIEPFDADADRFRPVFKYRLIDEGSYDLGELADRRNLAATLFWMEKTPEPSDLDRGAQRLAESLSGPDDGELRSAFASWMQLVRLPRQGLTEDDVPAVLGLEEFRTMLESQVRKWNKVLLERGKQAGLQEGLQAGLQKGLQAGLQKGLQAGLQRQRESLLRQIEVKFGELDARTRSRVRAAGPRRLLEWAEHLIQADRLSDVFVR